MDVRGVTIPIADPPINCGPPSFVETQAAVSRLKWVKLQGSMASMLNFSRLVEKLYSVSLHAVLCPVWSTGIILTDCEGLDFPLWKGKGDHQDCNNY